MTLLPSTQGKAGRVEFKRGKGHASLTVKARLRAGGCGVRLRCLRLFGPRFTAATRDRKYKYKYEYKCENRLPRKASYFKN